MRLGETTLRGCAIAGLLAVPALLATIALGAVEVRRLIVSPPPPPTPTPELVGDAIRSRNVERVYAMIRAGYPATAPARFQHIDLTGNRFISAAPLVLAAAMRDDDMVMMLAGAGAAADAASSWRAACLAEGTGSAATAEFLRAVSGVAAACPTPPPGVPLLDYYTEAPMPLPPVGSARRPDPKVRRSRGAAV